MIAPQQFVEAFLHEKAAAYAEANRRMASIHTMYFSNPLLRRAGGLLLRDPLKAVIEDVKKSKDSAIVSTREPAPRGTVLRERYHLSTDGESWRIARMDRECFLCSGTGRMDNLVCRKCNGEGWYEIGKEASEADA